MVKRIDDVRYWILRCYLPYLILKVLIVEGRPCSTYRIIEVIRQSFNFSFSAGSIYSTLTLLERKGYIKRSLETPLVELTADGKTLILKALRESETVTAEIHTFLKEA
jgi:DNA-binding PadR family transcriptional regulator